MLTMFIRQTQRRSAYFPDVDFKCCLLVNLMEASRMFCTKCGKEMREGYLFGSKDGAFSFANEVPGVFENAKNAEGFVEVTKLKPGHRTRVEANCCEECRMIVIHY